METNKIYQGDCLELMKQIEDKSIDLILCDLPYGKTNLFWDNPLILNKVWKQYLRILKEEGIVILTAVQPFTSRLVLSNEKMFKYELIWEKSRVSNPLNNNIMPSRLHESILVFYNKHKTYNPITYVVDEKYIDKRKNIRKSYFTGLGHYRGVMVRNKDTGIRQPQSVLYFNSEWGKGMHPTQKPVKLFEYLIKTYTNKGDLVLDNCIGSGTTAVACVNTKRYFIGIELSEEYCKIANDRLTKLNNGNDGIPPNQKIDKH